MTTETERRPLWPKPIPVIGGTGEFESGKTLFGLSICPGPATLYYDFEQSGASYDDLGHTRINVLAEMQKQYPNGYKPVDLFLWWLNHVKAVPAGKYEVIVLDPVTDLERGLTDWVFSHPQNFGHTAAQYQKMSGIAWGDVKDYEKSILADLSVRCQTLYYTAHLGKEFEGEKATGKHKVKGKATLHELASLFLWFGRKPDAQGRKPNKPAAKVLKSRLMVATADADGEITMKQVLPPVMPVCTPATLRAAFSTPAGGREIDSIERAESEELTDEERLQLEIRKAEAERDATLAKIALQGGGPGTAGKPTPPPEVEAEGWIAEADTVEKLLAVATRIRAAGYEGEAKVRLLGKFTARKQTVMNPESVITQDTPAA